MLNAEQASGRDQRDRDSRLAVHQRLLVELGGEYHDVRGADVGRALVRFAEGEGASQLVIGTTGRSRFSELVRSSVAETVLREAGEVDVHVVNAAGSGTHDSESFSRKRLPHLSGRRQLAGWLIVAIGLPALSVVLLTFTSHFNLASDMLVFLLLVTGVAVVGGIRPSMAAAVGSSLVLNVLLTDPIGVWTFSNAQEFVALVAFVVVGSIVSLLVSLLSRRSVEAAQARAEAEALARVAGGMASGDSGLQEMVGSLAATFGMHRVAVMEPAAPDRSARSRPGTRSCRWASRRCVGPRATRTSRWPKAGGSCTTAPPSTPWTGGCCGRSSRSWTPASSVVACRPAPAQAAALAQADRLRTAILRAVSHDLRTPLASIKASATSLLQDDIEWPDDARHEFLSTIDEETDRLEGVDHDERDEVGLERPLRLEALDRGLPLLVGRAGRVGRAGCAGRVGRVGRHGVLLARFACSLHCRPVRAPRPEHLLFARLGPWANRFRSSTTSSSTTATAAPRRQRVRGVRGALPRPPQRRRQERRSRASGAGRLANEGTVRTFTIVHRAAPGVPTPYVSVVVDLDGGGVVKANLLNVEPDPANVAHRHAGADDHLSGRHRRRRHRGDRLRLRTRRPSSTTGA